MPTTTRDKEMVQSLSRGIEIITAFNHGKTRMTISEVAGITDLPRGTARRLLLTLMDLGYVGLDGRYFYLKPKLLEIGYGYISNLSFNDTVQKHLNLIAENLHESASASVLILPEIVYVARASTNRLMTIGLSVGSKLPALYTSMGRAMLAQLPSEEIEKFLKNAIFTPPTNKGISSALAMQKEIERIRNNGYSIVNQELETGLISIGVAIGSHINDTYAAINVSVSASRWTVPEIEKKIWPLLRETSNNINSELSVAWNFQ